MEEIVNVILSSSEGMQLLQDGKKPGSGTFRALSRYGRQKILISTTHGLALRRIERERHEISDEPIVNLWL